MMAQLEIELLRSYEMKKSGHPQYQEVLFVDSSTGTKFICGTVLTSKQTEKYEGKEYPVVVVSISSASHPFFVGGKQFVDAEGRVDRFKKRYEAAQKSVQAVAEAPQKALKKTPKIQKK
jgi:large subunit ribosomal protein L31